MSVCAALTRATGIKKTIKETRRREEGDAGVRKWGKQRKKVKDALDKVVVEEERVAVISTGTVGEIKGEKGASLVGTSSEQQ